MEKNQRKLVVHGCGFLLLPADWEALKEFMPHSRLVQALSASSEYEVRTAEQLQEFISDLLAVDTRSLSGAPYSRGEFIDPQTQIELFKILLKLANPTTGD